MTIKKRITISNLLMLVVPAILIVVIAGGLLDGFAERYWKSMKSMNKNNGSYFVQKTLSSYSKEVKNNNIEIKETDKLIETLENAGYNLIITKNDTTVFSNLTADDEENISKFQNDILISSYSIVLEVNSINLVKNSFIKNGNNINLVAIKSNELASKQKIKSEARDYLESYIGIALIGALLIILFTNGVLSSRVTKSLIEPLDLLSYGAGQIEEGNLDFKINYEGTDEFAKVCSDFDKMRIRLKDSVNMQLQFEENKKELIAGISHDIRTPLTTIKGYAKGLRDGIANTPEKQKRYHEIIYDKACDLDMLVDKLFLLFKLDTGKFPFRFEKVNCFDFFLSFFNNAAYEFKEKNLNLTYENKCDNNVYINIDCEEIHRSIVNILENSVKYRVKEQGNVEIAINQSEDNIILKIKDDGPGVSEENLSRLFESFYREDSSRTNPSEGSGIGLSIAEHIIKGHKGKITAENMNGLCVEIVLPIYT